MFDGMKGLKRTHMCGELDSNTVGESVTIMGWVHKRRDLGGVIFVDLRDISGIVQVVFNVDKEPQIFQKAESLRSECVIAVTGEVLKRDLNTINPKIKTGEIEVMAYKLNILNTASVPPIPVGEDLEINDALRLKYRYLDLRRPNMQQNFILRHKVAKIARDYFDQNGFLEIETPMLTKSTPEGARDYLVPSRTHAGKFFALPQSPQLFKQLLMISGFDKYFQIAKCFRDEDLRADRQPEFTQIDVEMSFVNVQDILHVNEGFIKKLFKEVMDIDIPTPIQIIPYKEAMDRFGSDKPDLRFGLELMNVSDLVENSRFRVFADAIKNGGSVRAINVKGCAQKFTRKDIDDLIEVAKIYKAKGLAWISIVSKEEIRSPIAKFFSEDELHLIYEKVNATTGDLILFVADKDEIACCALGQLRLTLAKTLGLIDESKFCFAWITEFPLFQYDEEGKRWDSVHHPFTQPMEDDIQYIDSVPNLVRSNAYDIVLNGVEIGGGSIRIHSEQLQQKIFKLLGFTQQQAIDRFGFFLEAFKYGTPPHGGIAYGLDRLVMLMARKDSIRDVIAFPKVQNASCLITNAPDVVEPEQLKELHIKTEV